MGTCSKVGVFNIHPFVFSLAQSRGPVQAIRAAPQCVRRDTRSGRSSPIGSEGQPLVGSFLRRRLSLSLFDIFLLNVAHHVLAMQEVAFQAARQMQGYADKLIVRHLRPGNFSPRGNHVRPPLENERDIP